MVDASNDTCHHLNSVSAALLARFTEFQKPWPLHRTPCLGQAPTINGTKGGSIEGTTSDDVIVELQGDDFSTAVFVRGVTLSEAAPPTFSHG